MVKKPVYLYVEGGGDSESLHAECRKGFRIFLEKAGLKGKMPRIVACGGRGNAFDKFKNACSQTDKVPVLLVDSECKIKQENDISTDGTCSPWEHLKDRDSWEKPEGVTNEQCNLMVQCMESWFLADKIGLENYFGPGFAKNSLPDTENIEEINKETVYQILETATKNTKTKGAYDKGDHSFKLLQKINPNVVTQSSSWAKRFIEYLKSL